MDRGAETICEIENFLGILTDEQLRLVDLYICPLSVSNSLTEVKVARPSILVGTPSLFESLRLKQIDLFCKTIMHIYYT